MKKIKGNNIVFKTQLPALVELVPPVPASQMIPEWFTKLKMDLARPEHKPYPIMGDLLKKWSSHTIKKCPAVVDYFSEGYIIPLWSDMLIQRRGQDFHFETNHDQGIGSTIEFHDEAQFGTYPFKRKDLRKAVKFTSPWFFYTPPGWSMLFMPPLLHPNDDFTLFPGIVETDSFHQVNFPGVWHSEGDRILQRGSAFLHVIPFKRTKHKHIVEEFSDLDFKNNATESFNLRSLMTNGYRDITRKNRKKWKL
tara:strand:+ start:514 stop:1266 length:753 start_codon:yes stop_codon:yes gene_type:complete